MFGHCKDTSGLINDRVQLKIKYSFLYFLILWWPPVLIVCIPAYIILYNDGLATKRRSATDKAAPQKTSGSPLIIVPTTYRWRVDTLIYVHMKSVSPLLVAATSNSAWMYLYHHIFWPHLPQEGGGWCGQMMWKYIVFWSEYCILMQCERIYRLQTWIKMQHSVFRLVIMKKM